MKIETIVKAFAENNMGPISAFAESIMSRLIDCPDTISLVPCNVDEYRGLNLMYKDLEILLILFPASHGDTPEYNMGSDWLEVVASCDAGYETDADDIAHIIQSKILADLSHHTALLDKYVDK
ncbi:hypothetical protein HOT49_gp254 [Erwinia phage vB_EamM_Alexandra]|uniref:Uncharacterized protein n=1 Tax=Erwinia phage vB_EamM_Alexandra TaxID=2201424 RepID=A0A2Z4QEV6_9CAUD|nr:hypothetical protein HOT49_gp254 [Erwinia phage vB_EamM_Alexandra]AWY08513.1 hypothetical protein Alexandra_256 [Erwinia phage vB_EamM_Alexandra]